MSKKAVGIRCMKRYWIRLRGFDGHERLAETASKARYADFRQYRDAGYGYSAYTHPGTAFRDFLGMIEEFHHLGQAPDLDPRTPQYVLTP